MATGKDWRRLADLVSERRADLGMTQEDVRAAGGPSTATMRLIEGGLQSRYQPVILGRLETALKWERGSVRRILAGGDPVPVSEEPPVPEPAPDLPDDADVTTNVVLAAINPIERQVWAEIRRYPEGAPAEVIFADPLERALWGRVLTPERQRIREIAAYRSVQVRPTRPAARRAG